MAHMSKAACLPAQLSSSATISGASFMVMQNAVRLHPCQRVSPLTRVAVQAAAGKAGTKAKQRSGNAAQSSSESGERKSSAKPRPSVGKAGGFGAKASKPAPGTKVTKHCMIRHACLIRNLRRPLPGTRIVNRSGYNCTYLNGTDLDQVIR